MPNHELVVSADLRNPAGKAYMAEARPYSMLFSALLSVIHPELYITSITAMVRLGQLESLSEAVQEWPSVFSGSQIIANRKTIDHRDLQSRSEWYDILATVGPYQNGKMFLRNIGAELQYDSGTVVAIGGRVVRHEVMEFEGERLCYTNFIRADVHERMKVPNSGWSSIKTIVDTFM
jgi:hypothetical protein